MPEDRVGGIVEAVRVRVEEELRQQLDALAAEHDRALDDARRQADEASSSAEQRWSVLLANARADVQQQVETAVSAARVEFESERRDERARTLRMLEQLDRAASLTAALDALAGAIADLPAGALFVLQHGAFQLWHSAGAESGEQLVPGWESLLRTAAAGTAQNWDGLRAVPLLLGGRAVAVLLGKPDGNKASDMDVLAWAATARLAAIASQGLLAATAWTSTTPGLPRDPAQRGRSSSDDPGGAPDEQSARRYARLVISEIKLYNEGAVREGRERRDIARRLEAEIARAREAYDAHVPATLPRRGEYFHEELVRTLADGDPSLMA